MKKQIWWALSLLLLCTPLTWSMQEEEGVEPILSRYIEAIGGEERLREIRDRRVRGHFPIPALSLDAQLEILNIPPDFYFTRAILGDFGESLNGVYEDLAWEVNPITGPRIVTGSEREIALRQARIDPFLDWRENFEEGRMTGREEIEGEPCVVLEFRSRESTVQYYFSEASGLVLRQIVPGRSGSSQKTDFQDYREVDGILIPHLVRVETAQQTVEITLDSIEHDVGLERDQLAPPEEIRQLVATEEREESTP